MGATRFSPRIFWLILADAAFLYSGVMLAMYLRLGISGSQNELNAKNGWLKIALASAVCLLILYFYDLYDYIVMTNRRELLLRLVQALGIAWVLLALLFYFVPPLMIGRGVSVISVPIVLCLLLGWRIFIHQLTGHPGIGEKYLLSALVKRLSILLRRFGKGVMRVIASSVLYPRTVRSQRKSSDGRKSWVVRSTSKELFAAKRSTALLLPFANAAEHFRQKHF